MGSNSDEPEVELLPKNPVDVPRVPLLPPLLESAAPVDASLVVPSTPVELSAATVVLPLLEVSFDDDGGSEKQADAASDIKRAPCTRCSPST